MKIRLTPLGKVTILLFVITVISGFTLIENSTKIDNSISGNITAYKKVNSKSGLENLIKSYSAQASQEDSLKKVNLKIYFYPNLAEIDEEYYQALNIFVEVAKKLEDTTIRIEGNTANPAGDINSEFDKKLSLDRAKAVANYLIKNGIKPEQLIVLGNGSQNQVADNSTEESRRLNRRVEVYFKSFEKVVKR